MQKFELGDPALPGRLEVERMRRCISDLVGIMALPALWTGGGVSRIVSTSMEALIEMLQLAFVSVRFTDENGAGTVMTRVAAELDGSLPVRQIETALAASLEEPAHCPPDARLVIAGTDVSIAYARLGLHGELGIVAAGASRMPFPEPTERLTLDVAANQAAIALPQAQLLSRQRGVAQLLDAEVARRTAELAAASAQLQREIAEREEAEKAIEEREREARLLMDTIPGMVALLTATGELEVLNRQLLDYFGQSQDELRSWATNGTIHPDDAPHVIATFGASIASGQPYEIIQRFRRADGAYRWFENRGFPVRDRTGRIGRWCVLLTDVDERTRAEEALREKERESRLIVDSIPGLIVVLNGSGVVEAENSRTMEYLGPELANTTEWATNGIVYPGDRARVVPAFIAGVASGAPFEYEVRLRHHDGVYRWFQLRAHPLRTTGGEIARWYVLLTDIDQRKRAEDALRASELRLQRIIDTIPALAWSARPDGSVEFLNQHFLDFVGLTGEQASNWQWTAAVHPDDREILVDTWRRVMVSQTPAEAEARFRRHDGEYRWFLIRVNPFRDESGAIVKWYGVNTEIEDRKRAEDAVAANERNLRQMTETIPEMLWSALPDGSIDYCNTRFLEYTGLAADEVMNEGWKKSIHPDDAARVGPVWMACVASGAPYRVEVRTFHASDRTYRLCAVNALPLRDDLGRILKWHGTIVDMQDWKEAQDELRNAQAALAHVTRVTTMGELTASIAHEINQPLSGIVTNANTCLRMLSAEPPDLEGARETARRTIRDGHRASDVIGRLRSLFRRTEVLDERVDLNDTIEEVIALSATELHRQGIDLRLDLADGLPQVSGDRVQLQQVVLNLMMNAADAMSGVDHRERQLRIRTEADGTHHVRVTVQDTGVGFAPQDAERLFDAFFTTKNTGMGMGLSISRSIIARHDGRLWAAANEGPGATFSFAVPVRPVEPAGSTGA